MTGLPDYRSIFSLAGKVALVTGGCGILGRHFCAALAAHGASVAVVDLPDSDPEALAAQMAGQFQVPAIGIACDVSDPDSVAAMVAMVWDRLGALDVVMNNAGTKGRSLEAMFAPVEDYSFETWREIMAVNLDGVFLVAQAAGRSMAARGRPGSIIQTGSIYGMAAPDQRIYEGSEYMGVKINSPAVYCASKAGVHGLTMYLATYWAARGIRVNTLVPGGVESGQNDTFKQRYSARIPLGRMAQAGEMVGAAVFLASDASSYITGQAIQVDGGLSAW